jgi:hypothetical protein
MLLLFSPVDSPTCLLQLQSFFIYSWHGERPSPTLRWSVPHFSHHYKPSPRQAHWGRWHHTCLLWLACLFTVCMRECPSPTLRSSGHSTLFATCLFYYSVWVFFSFFPGWRSICPGGYADLSKCCLWEYRVLLICSPGGLPLPSRVGAAIWRHGSPPGFSI